MNMVGQTISHYKILEKLGEGGMGVVYKAEDTKLDRIVALKFLPHHLTSSEAEQSRFLQEAKAAAALNHPNVCSVIDIQEANDKQFIVMEYVDGVTLRKKAPVAKLDEAIGYAVHIGEALQAAHAKGIVHRDVKSENVMVTTDGRVKVMDFGLAKLKGSLKLTKTSSTVGTLAYMAPEQIRGDESDARSDIFSFGVVVFEMLTGKLPFRGEHDAAIMYSIVNEAPDSVEKYRQDTPADLDRIIHRALEKDPADRYQHIDDMVSELRRLQKSSARVVRPEQNEQSRTSQARNTPAQLLKKSNTMLWIATTTIVLLAGAAWFLFFNKPGQAITSIAVMPFTITSTDASADMLSDGITEGVINSLSRLPSLTVMSRNSVFRYAGANVDVQEIGKKLNVNAVLLGRIVQRGDSYAISVELVDAGNERHLWGAQYTKRVPDIYTLQGELSMDISQQLQVKLSGEEEKRLARNNTENSEAYTMYLKGRFYSNKRTADGLKKGIGYFNQAIEKDPNYALAYAGIADGYSLLVGNYFVLPDDGFPKAKQAVLRALELDNDLAEAHTSFAVILAQYDWDWPGSEREYKRAIELNPNYATAHHWYAINLIALGLFDDALREIMRAQQLDPLSLRISQNVGLVYYNSRQFDKTIEQEMKTIEMDSTFPQPHSLMGDAYFMKRQYDKALQAYQDEVRLAGDRTAISYVACVYAVTGRTQEALRLLDELKELSVHTYVPPSFIALVQLYLGNKDQAITLLQKAVEEKDALVLYLKVEPKFDPLRSDPRFTELVRKVKLAQ